MQSVFFGVCPFKEYVCLSVQRKENIYLDRFHIHSVGVYGHYLSFTAAFMYYEVVRITEQVNSPKMAYIAFGMKMTLVADDCNGEGIGFGILNGP